MNRKKHSFIGLSLVLALFLGTFSQNAAAQESLQRNRIKVSYGDAVYTAFSLAMYDAFTGGHIFNTEGADAPGAFSASYRRLLTGDRWAVGGDFTYAPYRSKSTLGNVDLNLFYFMAGVDCYYMKKGLVRLYGTASVGISAADGIVGPGFQVNPIAIRVGNDKIAGFAEVGVGVKGVFNVGIELGF